MVEVGGETFAFIVRIFTRGASFDGGRPPMPRTETADPGWTSWRRHDIVVDLIELDTCPRLLRVGVAYILPVCRW